MKKHRCINCDNRVPVIKIRKFPSGWYCHRCRPVTKQPVSDFSYIKKKEEPKRTEKECPRCKKIMGLDAFGIRNYYGNRFWNSWCKQCFREYNKEQRALESYKNRRKLYMREYRKRMKKK